MKKFNETLLFLFSYLIQNYGKPFESCIPECRQELTFVLALKEPLTWISVVGTVLAVAGLFLSEYNGKDRCCQKKQEEKSSKEQED